MEKKSVGKNAILNAIRIFMGIVFPLITFPYASQVLGAGNLGKVQFATSLISYFSLLAALGTSTYGTREGAKVRENSVEYGKLCSEVFSINLISTIIAYILLFILLLFPTRLQNYKGLIAIQSLTMILTTIGVDWIYASNEDFSYITKQSFIAQIVSMAVLFLFVKHQNDYYIYALTTVIASAGMYIATFIHSKKYVKLKLVFSKILLKHIKPMIVLFSNSLAVTIYVNSDVLMLGFLATDVNVGLYSVSVKVYTVVGSLIGAITTATIPRLALLNGKQDKEAYYNLSEELLHSCVTLILPSILGIFLLSKNIILILSGQGYLGAVLSLRLLSFALGFSVLASVFVNAILITNNEEDYVLKITIIAGVVNVGLNFFMIPLWKQNGAAITTIIAEAIVAILSFIRCRRYLRIRDRWHAILQSVMGCLGIIVISIVCNQFISNVLINTILTIVLGAFIYWLITYLLGNNLVRSLTKNIIYKLQ